MQYGHMRACAQVVGEGRCPIVDTWWQTETGAAMITPLPGAWPCVPGTATLPFFGVAPVLLDDKVGTGIYLPMNIPGVVLGRVGC